MLPLPVARWPSRSIARSEICRLFAVAATLPLIDNACSLPAGTPDVSIASHASVSRNREPTRLNSPADWTGLAGALTPGAAGAAAVVLARRTMSPGRVAASRGTVITPFLISTASATSRTVSFR